MCTSCPLTLDGVDDAERFISFDTWHGDACVESISAWVRMCELPFRN